MPRWRDGKVSQMIISSFCRLIAVGMGMVVPKMYKN